QEDIEDYSITSVECSSSRIEFSMHAVSPAFVLDLCNKIYNKSPETYLLHLKGYEWDFKEGLSPEAQNNFNKAFLKITNAVKQQSDFKAIVNPKLENREFKLVNK
ncbi:MAG: hypothetical protein J7L04_05850, partial [Bacteroidales bacterium]|nr:hypothetical protein [Bacteroidales bacterium]